MGELDRTDTEWAIVELAERQEALIRREQLVRYGLDATAIGRRLGHARLHRKHRGIYTVGHRLLSPRGEWLAAVWAVPGSVLSHLSAAAFPRWVDAFVGTQHVSTLRRATSRPGLHVHRVGSIFSVDIERHDQLAVTTPARTIVDLAAVLAWPELDGRGFHSRQGEMRTDRRRDRKLLRARYSTVRLVWEDLDDDEAAATVEDLLALLVA